MGLLILFIIFLLLAIYDRRYELNYSEEPIIAPIVIIVILMLLGIGFSILKLKHILIIIINLIKLII